ncbi:helix-turn-helix domain-containing protein [Protaetiibacter sp. SSC-01]|nr:helix-turn-helix domain-containing protein [Protaetiibacter sp. SSC-01]
MRLDARAVRVLAHPLRSRILSRLRLHGPSTATELAAELATNTGATSYHLRALESVGLVADTEEGVGKRRLWRASTDYHEWTDSDFAGDEDTQTALGWLTRDYVRQLGERAEQWLDVRETWPAEWSDLLGLGDMLVTVTPEQFAALLGELREVVERYREAGAGDPRARRIHAYAVARPVDLRPDDLRPVDPRPEAEPDAGAGTE